jgi:hypothetical protein
MRFLSKLVTRHNLDEMCHPLSATTRIKPIPTSILSLLFDCWRWHGQDRTCMLAMRKFSMPCHFYRSNFISYCRAVKPINFQKKEEESPPSFFIARISFIDLGESQLAFNEKLKRRRPSDCHIFARFSLIDVEDDIRHSRSSHSNKESL